MSSSSHSSITSSPVGQPQTQVFAPAAQLMPHVQFVQQVPVLRPVYPPGVTLFMNQVPRMPIQVLPQPPVSHPQSTSAGTPYHDACIILLL